MRAGAGLVALAILVPLAACGGSSSPVPDGTTTIAGPTMPTSMPTSSSSNGPLPIGAAATIDDGSGDVDQVSVVSVSTHRTGAPGHAAPSHGLYVVVQVRFDVTAGTDDISGGSFQVESGGTTYPASVGSRDRSGYAPTALLGPVAAGKPLTGTVVFDLPARSGTIQYAPVEFPLAEWTL